MPTSPMLRPQPVAFPGKASTTVSDAPQHDNVLPFPRQRPAADQPASFRRAQEHIRLRLGFTTSWVQPLPLDGDDLAEDVAA